MKTQKQKLTDAHTAYQAAKAGTRPQTQVKWVATRPVVPVPNLQELGKDGVQDLCHKWLLARRIFCNLHDCGSGFGIKHSGDIHGILPSGIHFEVECKRGKGGRLSVGQQQRMWDVRATGGLYFVVHGVEELEYYMKGLV